MFKVTIETGNDAFHEVDDGALEIARILREVANAVADGAHVGAVRDGNGHAVAFFSWEQ